MSSFYIGSIVQPIIGPFQCSPGVLAVLPFGLGFFLDFGPDPDFFDEIGPERVRIYTKKSGFD